MNLNPVMKWGKNPTLYFKVNFARLKKKEKMGVEIHSLLDCLVVRGLVAVFTSS